MKKVVGVSFKPKGKMYFFDSSELEIEEKDNVIVETEKGKQFGTVEVKNVKLIESKEELKKVVRKATEADEKKNIKNQKDAKNALKKAEELAKKYNLSMRFTESLFNFDRTQLLLYFVSDSRIDFRDLAKELASLYKTRIELRQIGIRDKAKEVSGIGQCGRELCCSCFLKDLDSVSISMAKNQNLALNPNKINGQCGRLLCCLKYEDEQYQLMKKDLPVVGKSVQTDLGEGKVVSVDILNGTYIVEMEKGNRIEIKSAKREYDANKEQ